MVRHVHLTELEPRLFQTIKNNNVNDDISRQDQSASWLPAEYGRTLDPGVMAQDAMYALSEVLGLTASSQMQFLSLIDVKLEQQTLLSHAQDRLCLPNLKYLQKILYGHIQKTQRVLDSIASTTSPKWPKASSPWGEPRAGAAVQRLEQDSKHLPTRTETLQDRTTQAIATLVTSISITEAQRAREQATRVRQIILLAIAVIPLSLTTSLFGMNVIELGNDRMDLKWWGVVTVCVLVASSAVFLCDFVSFFSGIWDMVKRFRMTNLNRLLQPQTSDIMASIALPREKAKDGIRSESDTDKKTCSSAGEDDTNRGLRRPDPNGVKNIHTKGSSFRSLKDNLRRFIYPSKTLEEALPSQNIKMVIGLLDQNFDQVAKNDFSWLHELDEMGYTHGEMAELLLESALDSPWIYFAKSQTLRSEILPRFHLPECVHLHGHNLSQSSQFTATTSRRRSLALLGLCRDPEEKALKQAVSELCGIGGVAPNSRDLSTWNGRVVFDQENSAASVTYSLPGSRGHFSLAKRIFDAAENFCDAAGRVQQARYCCDSFTILRRSSTENIVELCQIKLELAVRFCREFKDLLSVNKIESSRIRRCRAITDDILSVLGYVDTSAETSMTGSYEGIVDVSLHTCSLAVQFLCVDFLSYGQAHTGAVNPFFLDSPLTSIQLLGSSPNAEHSKISVRLVNLTCMGDMIQEAVVTFNVSDGLKGLSSLHDILASPEDLMDTWGPGHFITTTLNTSEDDIYAIIIGGGTIAKTENDSEKFHWSLAVRFADASIMPFNRRLKILIGTSITVNPNCRAAESERWHDSAQYLENLGTFPYCWETVERTSGVQAGQYFNVQCNQTWAKRPGNSLKKFHLALPNNHLLPFLECSWGVQVSFCTGIARRVPLRQLVRTSCPHSSTGISRYRHDGSF